MTVSLLTAFTGIIYSVMNLFNAQLSNGFGNYLATIIIHICGMVLIIPMAAMKKVRRNNAPAWMHVGGVLGVLTVVSTNLGVSLIGITPTLAIALIGQVILSMVIDQFAWFGFPKTHFNWKKGASLFFIVIGTLLMFILQKNQLSTGVLSTIFALVLILLGGGSVVVARITNARLAAVAGQNYSSLMNYLTGFTGAVILFFVMGMPRNSPIDLSHISFFHYLGGLLGVISIYLCNYLIPKVSAIHFTLLVFIGQLFSGIVLDFFIEGSFSLGKTLGGILVTVGMIFNVFADKKATEE